MSYFFIASATLLLTVSVYLVTGKIVTAKEIKYKVFISIVQTCFIILISASFFHSAMSIYKLTNSLILFPFTLVGYFFVVYELSKMFANYILRTFFMYLTESFVAKFLDENRQYYILQTVDEKTGKVHEQLSVRERHEAYQLKEYIEETGKAYWTGEPLDKNGLTVRVIEPKINEDSIDNLQ